MRCLLHFRINLEGDEFPEHLQPFLLTRTTHFLHELVSFARSPFNMAAYDQRVKYDWPTTSGIRDNWDPEATVNVVSGQLEEHSPQAGIHIMIECHASFRTSLIYLLSCVCRSFWVIITANPTEVVP